jgi:hypothetical protein
MTRLLNESDVIAAMPCTLAEPDTDRYSRGFFDGVMAYQKSIRNLPDADQWRGIEIARDTAVVWGYGLIEGDPGYTEDRFDMAKTCKADNGKWAFAQPMRRHDPLFWQPTHYQPLPAPPKGE